ncbi:hypothetical protein DB88DRAFT_472409 [Papiliotrema laurentii]|uniref:Uncharacterized protein n=1 Tax=Papiliotrema laurentii TaxID=5418 RepID=A0AAD9FS16_PAPLA|nr:hypothetical protein DB88DRAFT_472409 [Papiliotrema laurentii]
MQSTPVHLCTSPVTPHGSDRDALMRCFLSFAVCWLGDPDGNGSDATDGATVERIARMVVDRDGRRRLLDVTIRGEVEFPPLIHLSLPLLVRTNLELTRLEACALSEGREGEEQDGMTVERRRGSSCRRDPQIQIHLDDFYKSRRRFYKSSTRVRSVTNAIPIESPRYVPPAPPLGRCQSTHRTGASPWRRCMTRGEGGETG